jgi:platelet-activating factor acetylhydrolase IB subunit alpha
VFAEEASVKVAEKTDADILEKKWNSIVRLSKKVIELEAKITQMTEEMEALQKNGKSFHLMQMGIRIIYI